MATIINADTSDGLKLTSDTSGLIEFQSGGVTKAGVNATGLTGNGSQLTGLPAGYTDSDALTLFNASGSAPVYACRAWVNFNGSGVVAIRGSGNVSSITDVSTGRYIVNFTTAMEDANFATNFSANAFRARVNTYTNPTTTTSPDLTTWNSSGVVNDSITCLATFFR
ncbi:hypothetical protein N9070_00450 [bacterium]|nr:hypothetical protein [bacterium]